MLMAVGGAPNPSKLGFVSQKPYDGLPRPSTRESISELNGDRR